VKAHGNFDIVILSAEEKYVEALEGLKNRGTKCGCI